jgi:prevent-host-death family protein
MYTVGTFEAKTHFSALLEQVEKGELVIITKHGHPVAKLMPINETVSKENIQTAIQAIKSFNRRHTLGGLEWKVLRDEGRR